MDDITLFHRGYLHYCKRICRCTDEEVIVTVKYLCKFCNDSLEQGSAKLFLEASKPTMHRQNRSQYLQIDVTIRVGEKEMNNSVISSKKGLRTGFGKDVLTKKDSLSTVSLAGEAGLEPEA